MSVSPSAGLLFGPDPVVVTLTYPHTFGVFVVEVEGEAMVALCVRLSVAPVWLLIGTGCVVLGALDFCLLLKVVLVSWFGFVAAGSLTVAVFDFGWSVVLCGSLFLLVSVEGDLGGLWGGIWVVLQLQVSVIGSLGMFMLVWSVSGGQVRLSLFLSLSFAVVVYLFVDWVGFGPMLFVIVSHDAFRRMLPVTVPFGVLACVSGPIGCALSVWREHGWAFQCFFTHCHSAAWSVSQMVLCRFSSWVDFLRSLRRYFPGWVMWRWRCSSFVCIVYPLSVHYAGNLECYRSLSSSVGDISDGAYLRTVPNARGCPMTGSPAWERFLQHRGMRLIRSPTYLRLAASSSPSESSVSLSSGCSSLCSLPSSSCSLSIVIPMLSPEEIVEINDRLARLAENSDPSRSSSLSTLRECCDAPPVPGTSRGYSRRGSRAGTRGISAIPRTIRTRSIAATERTERSALSSFYRI
jgi:hypothetical protein